MKLSHYEDVHPNWSVLKNLDRTQCEAAIDLLTLATLVDGKLTSEEFDTLAEELQNLPFVSKDRAAIFAEELETTADRIHNFEQSLEQYRAFVDNTCSKINSRDIQMAVLRLLAIDITLEVPTETQQELYYAVGAEWEFDYDTLENVLTAAWESHEETSDYEAGESHHIPPILGANWARERTKRPHPNPFNQRMNT